MFENNFTGAIPREIGKLYRLRQLRMQDNQLNFNLTKLDTLGNLVNLITLDFYNNQMYGDVPASIQTSPRSSTCTCKMSTTSLCV